MTGILCSCTTDPRPLAGRRVGNGINYARDEVIWSSHLRYVFTGKAVSAALRDIPQLAAMNLRATGIYVRTDTGIAAVHLRSLKHSVSHLACTGFFLFNTGVYVHLMLGQKRKVEHHTERRETMGTRIEYKPP